MAEGNPKVLEQILQNAWIFQAVKVSTFGLLSIRDIERWTMQ